MLDNTERGLLEHALQHQLSDPAYQGDSLQMRNVRRRQFSDGWQAARQISAEEIERLKHLLNHIHHEVAALEDFDA